MGTTAVVRNGNVDAALKVLRAKNAKDGSSKKIRDREEGYLKKGVRRRIEKETNTKNCRKRNRNKDRNRDK